MNLSMAVVPLLFLYTNLHEEESGTSFLRIEFVKTRCVDWTGSFLAILKKSGFERNLS